MAIVKLSKVRSDFFKLKNQNSTKYLPFDGADFTGKRVETGQKKRVCTAIRLRLKHLINSV